MSDSNEEKKELAPTDVAAAPPEGEAMPDLEKLRDEKVFPVARGVFDDMVECLIPEDANDKVDWNPIVLKMLDRSLKADLNMTTETTYMFQLVLGILSGLNTAVQGATTVPIDDVRYGAIGKKILAITAKHNVRMTNVMPEESAADFAPVREEINALFAAEQLSMLEVKYVMDSIFEAFKSVERLYLVNLEQSTKRAEAKLFGVDDMTDLTVGDVDRVLKS